MNYEKALRDWLNHKQDEVKGFTRNIIDDIEDYADEWIYSLDPGLSKEEYYQLWEKIRKDLILGIKRRLKV